MADLPYTSEVIAMLFGWDDLVVLLLICLNLIPNHVWFAITCFVSSCRNNVAKMRGVSRFTANLTLPM